MYHHKELHLMKHSNQKDAKKCDFGEPHKITQSHHLWKKTICFWLKQPQNEWIRKKLRYFDFFACYIYDDEERQKNLSDYCKYLHHMTFFPHFLRHFTITIHMFPVDFMNKWWRWHKLLKTLKRLIWKNYLQLIKISI